MEYRTEFIVKRAWCPQCAIISISDSLRSTKEQLIERIAVFEKNIEIIGEYKNAHTKIECLCRNCGCEFVKAPKELLRGQGCPWCAGKRNSANIIKKPYE